MRCVLLLYLVVSLPLSLSLVPKSFTFITRRNLVLKRAWGWGQGQHLDLVTELKESLEGLCNVTTNNGVGASDGRKAEIEAAAAALEKMCPPAPAGRKLKGVYDLLYCTSPGGSSGKVGPFVGKVTQEFLDDETFINAVELFGGAVEVSLYATRRVLDSSRIRVAFQETGVKVAGKELFRKAISGSGVWVQRYVDDDLRVMNTPSLFVLKKRS